MTEHVIRFSHSSLKAYETCARQYHEVSILKKYPRQETDATRYGTEVHAALEAYTNGAPLPEQYAQFKPTIDALLAKPGRRFPEMQMAVRKDLTPCDWNAPDAWARGISDLTIVDDENMSARVVDWKSGGDRYPDRDQLVLMSLMTFIHFPHVRRVNSALIFIVKGSMVKLRMLREQADAFWWKYRERIAKLEASHTHGVWTPKQSGLCKRHCVVTSCEFNGNH